jgi:hypothetical protein
MRLMPAKKAKGASLAPSKKPVKASGAAKPARAQAARDAAGKI